MNKIYENIFVYGMNISYILYIVVLFGITGYAPEYLDYLKNFLKIYVAIILIVLYNPLTYKNRKFSDFDRKVVFSAGIFLLLTSTLISGVEHLIVENSKKIIQNTIF